ncbi:MAG: PTS sugar transporter subunit IIC [Anaerolineales bacterium]|nr:PTS sugar transporter subunit IIC [Anaerolineales bacterium]
MNATMNWFSEKLAPPLVRFTQMRLIAAILTGFMRVMPFLLVGAVFQILSNLLLIFAPTATIPLAVMTNLTFGLLGMVLAYTIGAAVAEWHSLNAPLVGLFSIVVFLILTRPDFSNGAFLVSNFSLLGATGLFVAIVAALFTGEVIGLFYKQNWIIGGKGMPDFVAEWFAPLIPGTVVIVVAWLVAYVANVDLHTILATVMAPVLQATDTYIGFVFICFLLTAVFAVGINGAVFFGVLFPLWMAAVGENAGLVAQGLAPVHINTIQTLIGWVVIGGTGAPLALVFLMQFSKSTTIKSLGRVALAPTLMNISEPLVFGLPIAFNPILVIPYIINSGILNPTLVWLAMNFDLVTKPFVPAVIPWVPVGFSTFLFNQDWRGVVLLVIEIILNGLIWYPFLKAYEKILIARERAEAVEARAEGAATASLAPAAR